LRGRGFLESDTEDAPPVAVVSRAFAERYWPGENPVGKQLRLTSNAPFVTVVGEAADIRYRILREATSTVYRPYRQVLFQGRVAVRTSVPVAEVLPAMESAIRSADPEAMIASPMEVDELLDRQLLPARASALLLAFFGATALILVGIGLYTILATEVRERTRELGLRAALGATPARLRASVLGRALIVTATGALVGLGATLVGSRSLDAILYQVPTADPVALAASCGILAVVVLAASYFPALRATQADPAQVLRD
jgi:hypothetical protein